MQKSGKVPKPSSATLSKAQRGIGGANATRILCETVVRITARTVMQSVVYIWCVLFAGQGRKVSGKVRSGCYVYENAPKSDLW
jgi:hypothetical protein